MLKEILNRQGIKLFGTVELSSLGELIDCRGKRLIPPGAKSVIIAAFPYYVGEYENANLCLYSYLKDYHVVIKGILEAAANDLKNEYGGEYICFTDNSPIPEVKAAFLAGLGDLGKQGLLITEEYGSYILLGEIVTDHAFQPSASASPKLCNDCGRCKAACPTQAIAEGDKTRCLSYITQRKGELTEDEIELIRQGGLVWGCDTCQKVCPRNATPKKTEIKAFLEDIEPIVNYENLTRLLKDRPFGYKGEKLMKRNLDIIFRKKQ